MRADDGNGVHSGAIDRQHAILVLEQNDALLRDAARGGKAALHIDHALLGWEVEEPGEKHGAQDAVHVVIQLRHGDFARLDRLLELFAVEVVHRLLIIEAGCRGFDRAVRSTPVRDHEALEAPISLEHIGKRVFVLAGVLTVDGVVGAHHRAWVSDIDTNIEGQQIGLLQGPLADDHVDFVAAVLLVVHDVVLDVADDMLGLLTFNPVAHQRPGQQRVFALILKGSSIARFAGQVDAAAEGHVVALGAQFAANQGTIVTCCFRVPAGRRRYVGRESGGVAAVLSAHPNSIGGVAHLDLGNAQARDAKNKTSALIAQIGPRHRAAPARHALAVHELDLLVQGHFLEHQGGSLVGRESGVHPWVLGVGLRQDGRRNRKNGENNQRCSGVPARGA